jgi:hypothetical protein
LFKLAFIQPADVVHAPFDTPGNSVVVHHSAYRPVVPGIAGVDGFPVFHKSPAWHDLSCILLNVIKSKPIAA